MQNAREVLLWREKGALEVTTERYHFTGSLTIFLRRSLRELHETTEERVSDGQLPNCKPAHP